MKNVKDNLPDVQRCIYNQYYCILLDDTERTFNLNMHSFRTFAVSEAEAIGKMCLERPEFIGRKILGVSVI